MENKAVKPKFKKKTKAVVTWEHGWKHGAGGKLEWKRIPVVKRFAIMAITACASRPLAVRGARSVIHRLDADGNAKLSKEEFKDMWNRWMPDQMDTFIFAFIDTDDNISISEEEFCNAAVALWAVCIACAVLWLLWLYCRPGEEEGREEGREETAARASTAAELRNQAIHDRSLAATAGIATVITTMDTYTLWWVSQWVEWRKTRIAENGDPVVAAHVRSYKDWVRATGARAAAGMTGTGGVSVPQTPE